MGKQSELGNAYLPDGLVGMKLDGQITPSTQLN